MATKLFGDVKAGATSVTRPALLAKTADGTPDTGMVAAGLTAYYYRQGAAATAAVTLSDLAGLNTAFTPGGLKEVADGLYRVDWPDAAFLAGADFVILVLKHGSTSVYQELVAIEAHGVDDVYAIVPAAAPTAAVIAAAVMSDVSDVIGADIVTILSKVTNLPASPAAVGSAMTLTSAYDAAKTALQPGGTLARVTLADTVTTYTGNTPQTGDAFAALLAGLFSAATVSAAASAVSFTLNFGTATNPANLVGLYCCFTGGPNLLEKGLIATAAAGSDSSHVVVGFAASTFTGTPGVGNAVVVG